MGYHSKKGIMMVGSNVPGNFLGFLKGTNLAPIANAMGGPNIKPRASIPGKNKEHNY